MFKKNTINAAVMAALGLAGIAAQAQEASSQQLERVEITGSSIRRAAAETALPVTTITREEITRTGATTAQDLIGLLPSSFGGTVVSNNVGATGGAATANLRALGSKYTLVLLNGRRIANFAFGNNPVDLNSIPLSAVERVEVLRDGASSLYGADAVAGVINFILRKDYQGAEANYAEYKGTHGNGGNASIVTGLAGFGDLAKDRFNVIVSASREEVTALKALDRPFANTAVRPDLGINKSSPRNGIPNLSFTDTNGNKYIGVNPMRFGGCNSPEFALVPVANPNQCGTDYARFIDLIPEQWRVNGTARGVFQVNEDNQIIAEVMQNRDRVQSFYSPAPYTVPMTYPANGRFYPSSITLPDGTKVTPTGPITGNWRTVAGGGRSDITETKMTRALIGAKGTIAGWDYDTAVTYSKNEGEIFFGPGQYSYAKLTPLMNAGAINIFGPQDAASKAALDSAQLTGRQQAASSTSTEVDFRVSREIYQLSAGAVGAAFGANFRKEKLDQVSEAVLESGDVVGGNGPVPSVSSGRKVFGVFGELVVPILKNLEANFAGRYDKYKNDFGTSFTSFSPKATLRYEVSKDLVLRGSVAKGYRAPTLYENLRPFTTGNNTSANWSDPIRCPGGVPITNTTNPVGLYKDECEVQLDSATSGDRNLKPEKSKQFSLGIAFSPIQDLTTSVDYWNVDIKDPIVAKSEIQVLSNPSAYSQYIYRYDPVNDPNVKNPIAGSQNKDFPIAYIYLPQENTGKTYASGLDFSAQYRLKAGEWGTFGAQFDGMLLLTHGYQYIGVAKTSDLGKFKDFGAVPRWRHALTVMWKRSYWDVSLTNNFTKGYEDYTDPTAVGADYPLVRKVGNYSTWDAQASLSPTKALTFTLGIKNLFDKEPPSSRNSLNFQVGYDATYTNPIGRQLYGRVNYKFF